MRDVVDGQDVGGALRLNAIALALRGHSAIEVGIPNFRVRRLKKINMVARSVNGADILDPAIVAVLYGDDTILTRVRHADILNRDIFQSDAETEIGIGI